ncbi:MAG: CpsD/CapB family tyrosine-protein kinase [Sphingopyxis sp.]|nr:CpsD/CapB family tyrosine-protein kinase [Sphingopyxis sp.]
MIDNPESLVSGTDGNLVVEGDPPPRYVAPRLLVNRDSVVIPGTPAAESVSALRNHLISQHHHQGCRTLAICSPHAGAGATFVATNLALAMADSGVNTLLVDANMRDPGIDQILTPERPVIGLREFLSADDGRPQLGVSRAGPNLSVIHTTAAGDQSSALLARRALKLLVTEAVRSFDFTIFDCPPAAHYGDARRIATLLRYAMVVVRRDHSFVSDVKTLIEELQSDGVNVVGTFLNILD